MKHLNFLSFRSLSSENGSGMNRLCIGASSVSPRKLFSLLFVLLLGVGQMWGTIASGTYVLCTSTSDLEANAHYIIANGTSGSVKCISNVSNNNNRKTVDATVSSSKISVASNSIIMTFTLGGSSGAWTFHTDNYAGTAGYLASAASGNNNYCRVISTSTTGTISFSSNEAVINLNPHTSRKKLRYNSSDLFACYSSGQDPVYLYKLSASCDKKVTVTKSSASNGSYTLKAGSTSGATIDNNGKVDNCDANATIVLIPSANTHYHVDEVTASNSTSVSGPDASGNYTITYTKGSNISTTIGVTFAADPTYTVTWVAGSNSSFNTQTNYAGTALTDPGTPSAASYCPGGKVFVGWTATPIDGEGNAPADLFTSVSGKSIPVNGTTYYAVFATASGGGSSNGSKTLVSSSSSTYYSAGHITGVSGTNKATWTADAFIMTQYKNTSSSAVPLNYAEIRAYQYHSLEFTPASGTTISSIVVTANSNSYASALGGSSISNCTKSVSGSTITITPTDGTTAITLVQGAQSRINSIVVNYTTGGGTTYSNYATTCCSPLASINGSVTTPSQTSAVVKLESAYSDAANADAYQLKVEGSSNYNDWTDVAKDDLTTSTGVTVNGLTCGTEYTAYLRAKGSGSYCEFGQESSVNFETSKYTVSVGSLTNGTITVSPTTACAGDNVTLTVNPSAAGAGYHLASWSVNGTAQDVASTTFTMPEADVTISATFEENSVPMAINITSTDKATVTSSVTSALANTNITLSCTDIDEGYQFFGWTVTAGGNPVEVTNPTSATGASFTMPAAVVTVTADIRQMVTVTFKRNNVTYDTQITYVGGTVTFPSNPTKFDDDYPNFIGWAEAIDGIATSAPTLKSASDAITANAEYHAVFANAPQPVNSYEKVTTTDDMVNNCKYVIAAWDAAESKYYAATGAMSGYNLNKVDVTSKFAEDVISAPDNSEVWKATVADSKVQFQNVGNSKYMSAVVNNTHTNFTLTDNSGEEYTYSVSTGAWTFTTSSLTNNKQIEYYDDSGKDYFSYYTAQDAPIYLFKQQSASTEWVTKQIVKHTISYNKNTEDEVTGSLPANAIVVDGEDYTVSDATLTRTGYNFIGWNTSNTATTAQTTIVNVTADATLYAVWEAIPTYNIEFSVNGAKVEALKLADQLEGTAIVFPDATAITAASAFPTTDKKFMGWIEASSYASDVAPTFVTAATATTDKTYYAVFADVEDNGYVKVTSALGDWSGEYILAYDNSATQAYVFNGTDAANDYVTATIKSNSIAKVPTGGVTITIAPIAETTNYSIKVNGGTNNGKYLQGSSSNGLNFQETAQANSITWDATYGLMFVNSSSYLRFNTTTGQTRFRYYKSTTYTGDYYKAISLYKQSLTISDYVTNIATLSGIEITTAPTKTVYKKGEALDLTGMVVKATYSDSRVRTLSSDKYTVDLADEALAASNNKFTVSYTEGETTKTAEQTIAVYELTLIAVTNAPATTTYLEGATFDKTGMEVSATWGTGADKIVETLNAEDYTVSPSLLDATSITSVTLSYTHEDVTKTTTQAVTVNERPSLTMSWKVAGATTTSKIYINNEEKYLLVLPSAPDVPEAFGAGYVFIGWTSDATIAKNGQGINWAANNDVMAKATEFKAVFAQVNAPLFKETFDGCEGTGGNDDNWSGTIASSTVNTDNNGWTFANEGGANACVKFGTGSKKGSAETPSFSLTGSATLIFKAGAWDSNSEGTTLNISATGATLKQNDAAISSVTLTKGAWTTYSIDVTEATGTVKIKFEAQNASNNRFFLDEVMIKQGDEDYKDYRFVPSNVARPEIELAEATYYGAQNATITQSQSKQIFYSLDGNTWTEYTAPVALDQAGEVTLSAKAYDSDEDDYSSVVSKSYTIVTEIDAPTMTASCVFVDEQTVTISHDMSGTEGFALQYSYDGENYTDYTEALTLTETATIYAKATIGSLEATANATYMKGYPVEYNKVTSADGLAIGQQFIIKASSANSAAGALSDNILASVDIPAEVSNIITLINEPVTVFELGGRSGAYTLISDGKYLKYKSDKKLEYSTTVADTWTITYSAGGTPTIKNVTNSSYSLQYNSSSPRFTVYSSDQTDVAIYAKEAIVYTLTIKNYDGSAKTTDKVVEGSSFILTEADAPTDYPANYEFLSKWTDGENVYGVGDEVVVSAAKTLEPCWKVTPTANVDINDLPATVTEIVVKNEKTLTVDEDRTLDNLTVENGGKVTLSNSNKLTVVGTFTIETTMASGNSGQLNGATESNFEAAEAYIDITLGAAGKRAAQWHAFTVPFPVDALNGIFDAATGEKLTNEVNYAIMDYHGDIRAQGKYGWKKYRGVLVPGTFYLMTVDGERATYRFKKTANGALVAGNTKALYKYASSTSGNDNGWNGVGNPTLMYGQVAYKAQVLNPESYTYEAFNENETNFVVGTPFFIQATENVTMTFGAASGNANYAPARTPAKAIESIKVRFGNEEYTDKLYISASEDALNTYETGKDLVKMTMTNTPKVAQIFGKAYNTKLCMVHAPMVNNQAEVALELYAPQAGIYTISVPAEREDASLYLTKDGNIIWDLTMSPYEAEFDKGQNNGYGLMLVCKAPQVTTGVETIDNSQSTIHNCQKVILNDHVYILRDAQLYDVTGKAVK